MAYEARSVESFTGTVSRKAPVSLKVKPSSSAVSAGMPIPANPVVSGASVLPLETTVMAWAASCGSRFQSPSPPLPS